MKTGLFLSIFLGALLFSGLLYAYPPDAAPVAIKFYNGQSWYTETDFELDDETTYNQYWWLCSAFGAYLSIDEIKGINNWASLGSNDWEYDTTGVGIFWEPVHYEGYYLCRGGDNGNYCEWGHEDELSNMSYYDDEWIMFQERSYYRYFFQMQTDC